MTNCKITAGLNGGVCRLLEDQAGFDVILIEKFLLYYPELHPNIVIEVDMTNVPTPGPIDFRYRSIWKQMGTTPYDPATEDLIDDDLIGTITYTGFTPFVYLKMNKIYMYTREACWDTDDHGTFQF